MPFIQIIEYTTSHIDELNTALDAWLEKTKDRRSNARRPDPRPRLRQHLRADRRVPLL